jgi:hypothetical protein
MLRARPTVRFVAANVCVWLVMVAILVVVPDWLNRWVSVELGRGMAWAVACGVWVIAVEAEWKARFGVLSRFVLQLILWVGAALVAIWISEQVNIRLEG